MPSRPLVSVAFLASCGLLSIAEPAGAQPTPAGPGPTAEVHSEDGRPAPLAGSASAATDQDRIVRPWVPRRELRFGTADFIVTGAAGGVIVGAQIVGPHPNHWRGGIAFDEDVRDALRVKSLYGRYAVRDASDVGVSLASTWPFLVDALISAWWYRGRADLARQMALVSAEAFAIAAAVQSVANDVASRERPYGRNCGTDIPGRSVDCDSTGRFRSFFSGHATLAFTSAGLLCMNHLGLGLLGSAGDAATCIGGFTVASMTSVFRVMSDMHYASDVAIGALVGTTAGIAIPWLHFTRPSGPATAGKVDLHLAPVGQGLGVAGTF